jgi:hypothetical protein
MDLFGICLLSIFPAAMAAEEPPERQTLALLRSARGLALEKKWDAAKAEYGKVIALAGAPAHHRLEAGECIAEIDRLRGGLPARDPAAARLPAPRLPAPGMEVFVAPGGSDSNPGTAALPFAALERARDEIRARRKAGGPPPGGAAITVRGGDYRVARTFRLSAEDSGAVGAPLVLRAAPGERPRFSGGARISGFRPVDDAAVLARLPEEARGKVMRADLRSQGIAALPPLRLGGFSSGAGFRTWPVAEVFWDGRPLPLAGWPNEGFVRATKADAKEGKIGYDGDRPRRWTAEPDAWLYGYWQYDWADSYERVASTDPERREISLAPPRHTYGYRAGARYRAVNLLAEIDVPGEWYLDRAGGILYLWPPSDPAKAAVELSLADFPLVEMDGASHVALVGLAWELGAADGIIVKGGERCLLAGCAVRKCGGNGIEVRGGTRHTIISCDIESMGRGGMVLAGGDRKTLAPGGHAIENCHIRGLSRIDHTYTPGVLLEGVGNRISRNLVHGVLSSAFRIEGNEHRIEGNEVFDVLLESDDQGGADMFGNPTYRGNVFRRNWWHHIGAWRGAEGPGCGHAGIRLDDAICGVLIYGNVFQKCSAGGLGFGGVQIHGGKENTVDGNLFVDCAAAISFSAWGEGRWKGYAGKFLEKGDIDRALYLERYPELARLADDHDANRVWRNVAVRCGKFLLRDPGREDLAENWASGEDPGISIGLAGEPVLSERGPAAARTGFRPIPMDEIGLYTDAWRTSLPLEMLREARSR